MLALITAALETASHVFGYLNTKESQKYVEECKDLKLKIKAELDAWPNIDDSKLEGLWEELSIIAKALQDQLVLFNAKK